MKFQFQTAVKIRPQNAVFAFTQWIPPHFRLQERFGPVFMPSKHDSLCHFLKSIWEIRDYLIFSNKFYHEHEELAEAIWNAIEDYKSIDEYRQMKIEFEK
jgi:hypothetical protein